MKLSSQLEQIESLLGPYQRTKREWFDIIGRGAKVLLGTLDSDDAQYYNDAIKGVNENKETLTKLMKDQINVVKTTIVTFNSTLNAITTNQKILFDNIKNIQCILNPNKTIWK